MWTKLLSKNLILVIVIIATFTNASELDLNKFLHDKLNSGENQIILPPGIIRLSKTVVLDKAFHDKIITGKGKTRIIMTRLKPAFFLTGCRNIRLDGFTVDYDPLPFTQGEITIINGKSISFKIDAGYPDFTRDYQVKHPLFFSKTFNWIWSATGNYATKVKASNPRSGTVIMAHTPNGLTPGDRICFNYRNTTVFKIRHQSSDITFSNLTIESGPGAAFIARRTAGRHHFRNVIIKRGKMLGSAKIPRLISVSADGINYSTSRMGPMVENCEFSFMGDDSINFHGVVLPVIKRNKHDFITVMGYRPDDLGKIILRGDTARILASGNFRLLKTAEIEKVEPLSGIEAVHPETVASYYKGMKYSAAGIPNFILYRITLKGIVPEVGQCIDIPAVNCPGYSIRNSNFHDHRARGLRLMSPKGVVANCSFRNLEQSAISLGPEYGYWREAGWATQVEVKENSIAKVCQGPVSWLENSYFPGAIAVFARLEKTNGPVWPGNTELTIIGNKITDCSVSGIFIYAANGVKISNNLISDVNKIKSTKTGRKVGISYVPKAICISHSKQIELKENIIQ